MASEYTNREIETSAVGKHSIGNNLYLVVTESKKKPRIKKLNGELIDSRTTKPQKAKLNRKWVFRFFWEGKARERGFGSYPAVSLADARDKAIDAKRRLAQGLHPIEQNRPSKAPTFGQTVKHLIEPLTADFRNAKHRAQWKSTLETYAAPLWPKPIDSITTSDVVTVLDPIWKKVPETASRVRGRIEAVLDAAKAEYDWEGENPARLTGHLKRRLGKRPKLTRGHHAAMAYGTVPTFLAQVRKQKAHASLALEFCVLTAARTGEVLGATWSEIDTDEKIWTIPGSRMKAGREHRVPLTGRAVATLQEMRRRNIANSEFVFPGQRQDQPLSGMAMTMVLRRMQISGVTVHGFRSSFRDWAGNETDFSRELAEAALAHVIGNKTEQAYRRDDALNKRRVLMDAWTDYCGSMPPDNDEGISMRARALEQSSLPFGPQQGLG